MDKTKRDLKKKVVKEMRKMNRINFIKAQQTCFKRLFKVTAGMMCMTCNANYGQFFTQNNGTWKMVMNKKVCTKLMEDCFPYLNATNL
jgi:hypothetical protein